MLRAEEKKKEKECILYPRPSFSFRLFFSRSFLYLPYFSSRKPRSLTRDTRNADYRLALFNRSSRIGGRVAPHRAALHCTRAHVRIFKSRYTAIFASYDVLEARELRYYSSRKLNDWRSGSRECRGTKVFRSEPCFEKKK